MTDPCKASAAELAAAYRDGRLSPVEVLEAVLARLQRINPVLNAVVALDRDGASAAARASEARWRAGAPLGPLDGIPLTVKDSLLVRGMPATWGSRLYTGFVPARDELPVARARSAGAVVFGKTNCPEFTLQGTTVNPVFGATRNPWDTTLTPGGSSGGAVAAVAAGLGPLALGTDGGGSTRRPAAHTGLVGLKPSRGRVPRSDGFPPILLDFEVIGAIARSVADVVALVQATSAPDPRDPDSVPFASRPFEVPAVRPLRILHARTFDEAPVDPEIASGVAAAAQVFREQGHSVEEVETLDVARDANAAWPVIGPVGLAWLLGRHEGWQAAGVGAGMAAMAESGSRISGREYFEALMLAYGTVERLRVLFDTCDVLLTPTTAALPWRLEDPYPNQIAGRAAGPRAHAVFTAFANAAGVPAISVPCTPAQNGLPVGFQLVGPFGSDGVLCALAAQYERTAPWAARWPEPAIPS